MEQHVLNAFLLTLFAGLSTGIGSTIAFFTKRTNIKFLSVTLAFSAGVLIYVSFAELFVEAVKILSEIHGESSGSLYAVLSFFGGVVSILVIDRVLPTPKLLKSNNSESKDKLAGGTNNSSLMRLGLLAAVILAIHNVPEGIVTFLAGVKDINIAIPIAMAIALHNIPEGIAVSVPIYYATGNRKKAFYLSFLSGLAEPLGAVLGYVILLPYLNENLFGIIFAAIAGILVFFSLDEFIPTAEKYGNHRLVMYGVVAGMAVMAFSLLLIG